VAEQKIEIIERIKKVIKAKGLTQKEFAQAINLAPSTITEYFAGRANPSDKVLKLISKVFGVSYEWLKEGKGEMFEKASFLDMNINDIYYELRQRMKEQFWSIPVIGKVGAGFPQAKGDLEIVGYFDIPKIKGLKPEQLFGAIVHGDSMAPTLLDGDTVIAKIYEGDATNIPNKKVVIVANPDGELYVKRLFKADGKFILLSDNPSYPPIYPEEEGYRVIGIAIKFYREGKL